MFSLSLPLCCCRFTSMSSLWLELCDKYYISSRVDSVSQRVFSLGPLLCLFFFFFLIFLRSHLERLVCASPFGWIGTIENTHDAVLFIQPFYDTKRI